MREILFKAKRKDNGEWIEGYYVRIGYEEHHIFTGKLMIRHGVIGVVHFAIIPETLSQYTGQKDCNKDMIFENHIVSIAGEDGFFLVEWDNETSRFVLSNEVDRFCVDFDNYYGRDLEIVGNRFDNPEFLGGDEN